MTRTVRFARLLSLGAACAVAFSIAAGDASAGGLRARAKARAQGKTSVPAWSVGPAGRGIKHEAGFFRLKGKGARDLTRLSGELPAGERHELVRYDGGVNAEGRPVNGLLVKDAEAGLVYEQHLPEVTMEIVTRSGLRINAWMPEAVQRYRVDTRRFSLQKLQWPAAVVPKDIAAAVRKLKLRL